MTHAVEMLDHRHPRLATHALDQAFAATRHDDVDVFRMTQQRADCRAIGRRNHLHAGARQARAFETRVHAGRDGLVRMQGFRAATQDGGVAGFQAQRGGIRRHVRPCFVNDADDAERHTHVADLDAGRAVGEIGDDADRVGERGDFAHAGRHRRHARRIQREPIAHRGVEPGGRREIARIGGQDVGATPIDLVGDGEQRLVLRVRGRARERHRRRAGRAAEFGHVGIECWFNHGSLSASFEAHRCDWWFSVRGRAGPRVPRTRDRRPARCTTIRVRPTADRGPHP